MFDATPPGPALSLRLRRLELNGVPVLGALELDLHPQETIAITGPSGAGKTSLLRVLAGLQPDFDGLLVPPLRVSMVFQEPRLLPWRSALMNLTLTTGLSAQEARKALKAVGLEHRVGHRPDELSLGQQRRLSLARAFAIRPTVLLMDEPFVSLDAATSERMMDLFCQLRAAHPVATVLVTHDRREAEHLADRELRLSGAPASFRA